VDSGPALRVALEFGPSKRVNAAFDAVRAMQRLADHLGDALAGAA
jgi:hypothetical protein